MSRSHSSRSKRRPRGFRLPVSGFNSLFGFQQRTYVRREMISQEPLSVSSFPGIDSTAGPVPRLFVVKESTGLA
jgi:hypothetical protein